MKKIEPKFIEKGEGDDIFAYYREFYSVDDPTESNIITIKASSTLDEDEYNWSDVSVIISKREGMRWVSQEENDFPYITIDFHSNYIDLLYYTFETHPGLRYNKEWKISGIRGNNKEILIDYQDNDPLCSGTGCSEYTSKTFTCKYPGVFNKFKIQSTAKYSENQKMLSFSGIQFFGVVYPSFPLFTCKKPLFIFKHVYLYVIIPII